MNESKKTIFFSSLLYTPQLTMIYKVTSCMNLFSSVLLPVKAFSGFSLISMVFPTVVNILISKFGVQGSNLISVLGSVFEL